MLNHIRDRHNLSPHPHINFVEQLFIATSRIAITIYKPKVTFK